jgi:hypothetical protein
MMVLWAEIELGLMTSDHWRTSMSKGRPILTFGDKDCLRLWLIERDDIGEKKS